MKTIKKLKKSTKAVAGSALLVGATLAGGASMALAQDSGSSGDSYDLGSYPNQPFIDEDGNVASSIVVGEDAKPVDVVSAIDVAGQLGNNAFAEEEKSVEGGETTEVNGVEAADAIRGVVEETVTATDYDDLVRNYEYGDDENRVTEEVSLNTTGNNIAVDDEAQARVLVGSGELQYTATYPGGVEQGESLYVLGNEYEITSAGPSELQLGSTKRQRNLGTGDTVEHGPFTVEVTDNDGEDTVYLTIMQDGETLAQETFTPGEPSQNQTFGEDDQFMVDATSVFFGNEERVTLETTYTDTTVESGEVSPWDEDYNVDYSYDNGVENLTLSNNVAYTEYDLAEDEELQENEGMALAPGESLEGPNEAFAVDNLGLSEEATEEVDFSTDFGAMYTDVNGFEQDLSLTDISNGTDVEEDDSGYIIVESTKGHVPVHFNVDQVTNGGSASDEVQVTFKYGGYEETVEGINNNDGSDSGTASGYGFTVQVTPDDNSTISVGTVSSPPGSQSLETDFNAEIIGSDGSGSEIGLDALSNGHHVNVTEDGGVDLQVQYEDGSGNVDSDLDEGEIGQVVINNTATLSDVEDGAQTLSNFGSHVELASEESASIVHPENERMVQTAVGEVTTSTGNGETYTERTPTGFSDVGALDTDNDIDTRMNSDTMILVGGPSVNDLVSNLADEGQTWTTEEYTEGEGLLQTISTEAYDALLISGQSGEDTRAAADFLTNYEENADDLEGSTQLSISTENGQVVE